MESNNTNGHSKSRKGLLERLRDGIIVGDGGFVIALEKRGYVMAGPWTPEAVIEHPDAVEQLHKEFLRAGSDVMQAFTFYGCDDKLNISKVKSRGKKITCVELIESGCRIAKKVAESGNALMAGSISQNPAYVEGKGKNYIKSEALKQSKLFKDNEADFIICEFFQNIEEMEWTIEECVKTGLPVVSSMSISVMGDKQGVSPGECAVRMARAGAHVVGVNCIFDPWSALKTIKLMKTALDEEGLHPYLITQPNGFYTTGTGVEGYAECPEYPFAMETRTITRMDAHKYAREAYNLGVRYIGACCGFEAYHVRAISEELAPERGFLPEASEKHEPWGSSLRFNTFEPVRKRANREHWENIVPHSGRPTPPTYDLPNQ